MSLHFPVSDIAKDSVRNYPSQPFIIITDHNLPIKIFTIGYGQSSEFHIYTTSIADCMELGSYSWPYQKPEGYMCHGETKYPVRVPYVGQPIWFWSPSLHKATFSGQFVNRIYYRPVHEVIFKPWLHLKSLLNQLGQRGNPVDFSKILITTLTENSYDDFFKKILIEATRVISKDDSIYPKSETGVIYHLIKQGNLSESAIFESGFIFEENGCIQISDALLYLFMEAIHHAKPMATIIDDNGILRLAN